MRQNYINHIALVLDRSSSMQPHAADLVKVADGLIAHLAQLKDPDHETRVTVYLFNAVTECLIYDKDVLRMPSIAGLYRPSGMTALCSATVTAIGDLKMTPEKYGDHSFLVFVLTDGQENSSRREDVSRLPLVIGQLPDHWTLGAFVPDQMAVHHAKQFGFPAGNISVWDASKTGAVLEVGEQIRRATDTFMENRARGVRGTKSLFVALNTLDSSALAGLTALTPGSYFFLDAEGDCRIDELVSGKTGRPYTPGKAYYQLTKTETIQPSKQVAIAQGDQVFMGDSARHKLGLPDMHVKVRPGDHPGYAIFIQSTSMNRKILGGTRVLVMR